MSKVITSRNVYTGRTMDLCQSHYDARVNGDDQVQHGLHAGTCAVCSLIGQRVEGGEGDDYDTGRVESHIEGDKVMVAWDSLVKTPACIHDLTVI